MSQEAKKKFLTRLVWRWPECVPIRMRMLVASGRKPATTIAEETWATTVAIQLRANARLTKPNLLRSGTFCS